MIVTGSFNASAPTDRVLVPLQAGEILTAGLDVNYPAINANFGSALKVYSPSSRPRSPRGHELLLPAGDRSDHRSRDL